MNTDDLRMGGIWGHILSPVNNMNSILCAKSIAILIFVRRSHINCQLELCVIRI